MCMPVTFGKPLGVSPVLAYFNRFNAEINIRAYALVALDYRPSLHDVGHAVLGRPFISIEHRLVDAASLRLTTVAWKQR